MFEGFSREALEFLLGIRLNNNKEWFEPRKQIYVEKIYEPMKALGDELFAPFSETEGMMKKVGRIYRDEHFPPYLHYRDVMWIYVRYDAYYWNRTPTLYFELSPEGAEFGFRIAQPEAAVMERFRSDLTENAAGFLSMIDEYENKYGYTIGGVEYKRKKKCTVPEAERFFLKKGLSVYTTVSDMSELSSHKLSEHISDVFRTLIPINDYFHELVEIEELSKALEKNEKSADEPEIKMVKAPDVDFMW